MYCVLADRLDCADTLLKAGADVNKTDHSQRTALHLAAQKVRSKITIKNEAFVQICQLISGTVQWMYDKSQEYNFLFHMFSQKTTVFKLQRVSTDNHQGLLSLIQVPQAMEFIL